MIILQFSSIGTELQALVNPTFVVSNLEYADNRISKYSMQRGKCAITGRFLTASEVYCHHIIPRALGGTDKFKNLVERFERPPSSRRMIIHLSMIFFTPAPPIKK